jgi:hypothetical protein
MAMAHSMSLRTARTARAVAGLVGVGIVATTLVVATTLTAVSAAAVVDPIVGDWNVTYGAPAIVTMTLTNGVYTETAATPVRVVSATCDLPVGTVIATFSAGAAPSTYTGQHGLWSTFDCSFAFFTPMTLTLSADQATLTAQLNSGGTVVFTRASPVPVPVPVPAPSPGPAAQCSRATARALLLSRHLGNPPEPERQVLCGHFTGRHSHAMVVSLSTPGCGGSIGWLVFRRHHNHWQTVLSRNNGATLAATGHDIRETMSVLRPTDTHCQPTGGTRTRIWHWTGHGFTHTAFRHHSTLGQSGALQGMSGGGVVSSSAKPA